MAKDNVYIWYSGATDITGKALQQKLDITGGTKKPTNKDIIIGWGTKTKKHITLPNTVTVLNHPNNIKNNRNKHTTLSKLKNEKIKVADFCLASEVLKALNNTDNSIILPLVGRKKYHQGGKGFWLCLTIGMVKNAISEGCQYFQNYIDINTEYRLHIFKDKLLYAVKKIKRTNMENAFIEQHAEKIKDAATKNNMTLNDDTMNYVLAKLAKENPTPDMIIRSNTRGWKFSHIKKIKAVLKEEAIKALKAAHLDFGAVDCCIDSDEKAWIIEINSGPGLKGTPFDTYLDMFKTSINEILNPTKTVVPKAKTIKTKVKTTKSKTMKAKADLFADMIEQADENEAQVLKGLMNKILVED